MTLRRAPPAIVANVNWPEAAVTDLRPVSKWCPPDDPGLRQFWARWSTGDKRACLVRSSDGHLAVCRPADEIADCRSVPELVKVRSRRKGNAKDRADRRCLRCGRLFPSACRGNRICGQCSKATENVIDPLEWPYLMTHRNTAGSAA